MEEETEVLPQRGSTAGQGAGQDKDFHPPHRQERKPSPLFTLVCGPTTAPSGLILPQAQGPRDASKSSAPRPRIRHHSCVLGTPASTLSLSGPGTQPSQCFLAPLCPHLALYWKWVGGAFPPSCDVPRFLEEEMGSEWLSGI